MALPNTRPEEFRVLVLDNGAFHKARRLEIPKNIGLLFLPPYSPELNPAEKMWRYIKDRLANLVFKTLPDLSDAVMKIIQALSSEIIQSITGCNIYTKC